MRLLFLSLLLLVPSTFLSAQVFDDLTTDYTGSQLYFTSEFRLKGSGDDSRPKIFRWRNGVFEKMAEAERLTDQLQSSFFYGVSKPYLSSDGLLAGWSLTAQSTAALSLSTGKPYLNRIPVPNADANAGFAICRNGPWIAFATSSRSQPFTLTLRQRITGAQRIITADTIAGLPLNWQIAGSDAWLTNDGAVLVTWLDDHDQAHFGIISADGLRTLDTAEAASNAWIDPTGRWVVYITGEFDRFNGFRQDGLHVLDLSSNLDRVVTLPANSPVSTGVIFDDLGQTVTLKPQAATIRLQDLAVGSLALPDDTQDFTISGDGTRLFALTYTGRLQRKDLLTGKVEVLCGKTPNAFVSQRLVPGSLASAGSLVFPAIRIIAVDPSGQALEPLIPASAASVYLDPKEPGLSAPSTPTYQANGLSVLINETPVPLWSIAGNEIRFQLPWTFPVTSARPSVRVVSADSPFEVTRQVNVATQFATFETAATNSQLKIIHQNNRGVVTSADPAVPGEIVQAYMTGLNLASAPPRDGMLPPSAVPAVNPNCGLFGRNS